MKKLMLFGHEDYYPSGGWGDFKGDFDTVEEAQAFIDAQRHKNDTYDLIDTETKEDRWQELSL